MALPTSAFNTAKSIFAGLSIVQLTIGETDYVFESRLLKHKLDQEIKNIERPDSTGVLRKVRTVVTKQSESWQFELDEAKRLIEIFSALAGKADATCTLWIPDPNDDTGKVALASEAGFACFVTRDGDVDFGNSEFTKATINIDSNKQGAVTWTVDGAVPA